MYFVLYYVFQGNTRNGSEGVTIVERFSASITVTMLSLFLVLFLGSTIENIGWMKGDWTWGQI